MRPEELQNFLPTGWMWTPFSDVVDTIPLTGRKLKQSDYRTKGKLPVIDQGQVYIGGYTDFVELKVEVKSPLVVFGDHTKVVKYVNFDFVAGADGVKVLQPADCFEPKFFFYLLYTVEIPEKGYARHFQFLQKTSLPLPPLPEQRRIVAKIEELFTKLDAGVKSLKEIQKQLKRYRQSVLKAAFEGKLTAEWRQSQISSPKSQIQIESASALLERIRQERQRMKGLRDGKGKANDLPPFDTSELPMLPEGWLWITVGEVVDSIPLTGRKLLQSKYQQAGKLPVIDQGRALIGGFTDREELRVSTKEPLIIFGDHTRVVKYIDFDFVAGADGVKVLKPLSCYTPKFFYYSIQATDFPDKGYSRHYQFLQKALIPLSPLAEQHQIVSEIERHFSVADVVEKIVEQSLVQAERLRQSILKKAFEGKLVPQDPSEEPASVLLERIKVERERSGYGAGMRKQSKANLLPNESGNEKKKEFPKNL